MEDRARRLRTSYVQRHRANMEDELDRAWLLWRARVQRHRACGQLKSRTKSLWTTRYTSTSSLDETWDTSLILQKSSSSTRVCLAIFNVRASTFNFSPHHVLHRFTARGFICACVYLVIILGPCTLIDAPTKINYHWNNVKKHKHNKKEHEQVEKIS